MLIFWGYLCLFSPYPNSNKSSYFVTKIKSCWEINQALGWPESLSRSEDAANQKLTVAVKRAFSTTVMCRNPHPAESVSVPFQKPFRSRKKYQK